MIYRYQIAEMIYDTHPVVQLVGRWLRRELAGVHWENEEDGGDKEA